MFLEKLVSNLNRSIPRGTSSTFEFKPSCILVYPKRNKRNILILQWKREASDIINNYYEQINLLNYDSYDNFIIYDSFTGSNRVSMEDQSDVEKPHSGKRLHVLGAPCGM